MAGLLSAFSGDFELHPKVSEVLIAPLDREGKIDFDYGGPRTLQFWPETISDSRNPNWQSHEVAGAPLPLYQWVSGGERPLSFTAVFSRDMYGEIGKDVEEDKHNVDVDAAVAWLHSLSAVDYQMINDIDNVAVAPPVLWVLFQGTKLGYNRTVKSPLGKTEGGIYLLMMEVGVERTAFFPDGRPRHSTVSLSFVETMQIGRGIYPTSRRDIYEYAQQYTRKPS